MNSKANSNQSECLYLSVESRLFLFLKRSEKIADLLTKVLKHFAQDGLETTVAMLNKEPIAKLQHVEKTMILSYFFGQLRPNPCSRPHTQGE